MAFRLEKNKTTSTPYVLIDEESSYMKLEGRSFHENITAFFNDINAWLDKYLSTDFGIFTLDCQMNYFNSSTLKILLNMFLKMDSRSNNSNKITINWITTEDNDVIIECGEDFQEELANIEFNIVYQ